MTRARVIAALALVACRAQEHASPTTTATATTTATTSATTTTTTSASATTSATSTTFTFDADAPGSAPSGLRFGRTGRGREGAWLVRADATAPSGGNVLAQTDADATDDRYPLAWLAGVSLRDVDVRVRCKAVAGKVDRACGLVWRVRGADDYYLTRANALEDNVRLYFVKGGRRTQVASFSGKVSAEAWHELRATARADRFEVYWDGAKVIDARDATFPDAGSAGVWTKADSITYFDDLIVTPL